MIAATPIPGYVAVVPDSLPLCDYCSERDARYDCRCVGGGWANTCEPCFFAASADLHLGVGMAQYLATDTEVANGTCLPFFVEAELENRRAA